METLLQFITRLNLQLNTTYLGKKVPPFSDKSKHEMFHWRCDLKNLQGRHTTNPENGNPVCFPKDSFPSLSLDFYRGLAHQGFRQYDFVKGSFTNEWKMATEKEKFSYKTPKPIPPNLMDILSNLHMTATSLRNSPFWEDWANELGYNPDSIKDKEIYDASVEEYRKLHKFLGSEFENFLNCENDY